MQPHEYDPLLDEHPPSPAGAIIGAVAGAAAGIGAGLLRIKNRAAHTIFTAIHVENGSKIASDFAVPGTVLHDLRKKVQDHRALKVAKELYEKVQTNLESVLEEQKARPWYKGLSGKSRKLKNIVAQEGSELETASDLLYRTEINAMAGKMKWADKLALTTTAQKAGAVAFGIVAAVGIGALVKEGIDKLTARADDRKLYTQLVRAQALAAQPGLSEGNAR